MAVNQRIEAAKDLVVNSYDNDPGFDAFMKGMIRAFSEVLDIKPEFGENLEDEI